MISHYWSGGAITYVAMVKLIRNRFDGQGYVTDIDYGVPVKDIVKRGHYKKVSPGINSKNFPTKKGKKDRIVAKIIEIRSRPVFEDINFEIESACLRKEGYEFVGLRELLAVLEQHKNIRALRPIFALGSKIDIRSELLIPGVHLHPVLGKSIELVEA